MTEPHRAVIDRLKTEFTSLSHQLWRVSDEITMLDHLLGGNTTASGPASTPPMPTWAPAPAPVPSAPSLPPPEPPEPRAARTAEDSGWVGKLLAVAGVTVTLVGVVLLLVLAAQAGVLRPEIRVVGGGALSATLIAVAVRLQNRPGGRTGAIALAATGIAAAYLNVIAVTTVYNWVTAPLGLILAAAVGGTGLVLARRWDSEHLGLLVLVPMIGLAPVITDSFNLLLIGFLLSLSAAALPVQLGKDWTWMLAARIAAPTVPLLAALVVMSSHENPSAVAGACAVAALLAFISGLLLLPTITNKVALALLTATGTLPMLAAGIAVDRMLAVLLAATLAASALGLVLACRTLPLVVTQVWSALSAVAALIAVTDAFHGGVKVPFLLVPAVVIAVAGRYDDVARRTATGFGIVGVGGFVCCAPPSTLVSATVLPTSVAVSTLAASVLVIAYMIAIARAYSMTGAENRDHVLALVAVCGALAVYGVTAFTVTAGVLLGGTSGGFLSGHVAATICWTGMAAGLFVYALRLPNGERRTVAVTGGLALTAAATAKLFLFDLGTLDGILRGALFIVVGLALLAMGAGYARSLAQQERNLPAQHPQFS